MTQRYREADNQCHSQSTQPTYIPPVEDVGLVDRDYQADKQYYRPKGKAQMQIYQQILCHHFPDRIMRIYADHQRRVGCRHITPAFLIVDGIPEEIKTTPWKKVSG